MNRLLFKRTFCTGGPPQQVIRYPPQVTMLKDDLLNLTHNGQDKHLFADDKQKEISPNVKPITYLKIPTQELERINLEEKIGLLRGFRLQLHGQFSRARGTGYMVAGAGIKLWNLFANQLQKFAMKIFFVMNSGSVNFYKLL